MSLSERIRSGCEAAPWVSDEIQNLEAQNEELLSDVEALKAVNAELLDACKGLLGIAERHGWLHVAVNQARAAIAKAEGGIQ